ncbi:AMP-binding protein [Variovorax sp. J22R24]|uniref:AMP-binding protein n=1 Tax=Variovorax gracilis TaxID=3053502 RepID=UPI002578ECD7|nr:AMP-binding protein [Variovorax sp. J22R24]MDM0109255.1 AMP-binding protein [Variovorax sp. J22R24]
MQTPTIRGLADVLDIESRPYDDFMPHGSVLAALEAVASEHAGRPAITYIDSHDPAAPCASWTHAEFIADVRRAARTFMHLAGGEQPRVAFLLPAIPQAYLTLFGAEAVGVACPINYLLGEEHIAELIDAAGVNILVALGPTPELDIWSRARGLKGRCPSLKQVVAVGSAEDAPSFGTLLEAQSSAPLLDLPTEQRDRLAALFHTGGTTGRPKLAKHTHRNQLHAAWGAACMYGATAEDVILNGFPLFHVAGSFVYGLSILLAGGQIVLPSLLGLRNAQLVQAYWRHVERHRVTLLATVPTVMSALLGVPRQGEDLSTVRCLLTGGSPLPSELAESFESRTAIPVRNILGMTECGGVIAIEPVNADRVAGSVGLPLPFTSVQAVDDAGAPLSPGRDGVLHVRGPNVGPGYVDADNNLGVFTTDGWLVTGDVGHRDAAGRVFVTGRSKDLIIRSSHNIDPVVIEDALLRHPDVLMAAAVGAPDEYAGEVPIAFVSLRPGAEVSSEVLSAFAQDHIPERPAYPKAIFVLDALPVTAIGKLFKPALRTRAIEWVINDRLQRIGLHATVHVRVETEGKTQVVRLLAPEVEDLAESVRNLMAPFALKYRLEKELEGGRR